MLFSGNSTVQLFVRAAVVRIKATVTYHFKVFFRNMPDEAPDKFHDRDGFLYIGVIFVAVVMECDIFPIIVINTGGCNYWPAKVTPNVFDNRFWVAFVWLCIDIEPVFVVSVAECLCFFEGRTDCGFHFIKERGAQESVVKMFYIFPEIAVAQPTFRQEAVDMRVPFQVPPKSMEDKDKPGRVVHGFVHFVEHTQNDAAYGMKKAVKECAVFQEKIPQVFINSKNTMPVLDVYQFKGHVSSPLHSVFVAASGAETAFAAERDKFKLPAFWAAIHGAAKRRVADAALPLFYGKISGYVVIYRDKDKNTTQGNLAELVGSPVALFGCK